MIIAPKPVVKSWTSLLGLLQAKKEAFVGSEKVRLSWDHREEFWFISIDGEQVWKQQVAEEAELAQILLDFLNSVINPDPQ